MVRGGIIETTIKGVPLPTISENEDPYAQLHHDLQLVYYPIQEVYPLCLLLESIQRQTQ
jgi:hypothetical protein